MTKTTRLFTSATLLASLLAAVACGSETHVNRRQGGSAVNDDDSADANPLASAPGAAVAAVDTPAVKACHAQGLVYERRQASCNAEVFLASSYGCDRAGIEAGFTPTGFQIAEALSQALGTNNSADTGDGFMIDQCGETADGRYIVYLMRQETRNGKSLLTVREIEAQVGK